MALAALFVAYPAVDSIRVSLFRASIGQAKWVGIDNYLLLMRDAQFLHAAARSLLFATLTATFSVTVGSLIALALDRRVAGHKLFQFLIFLPVILPAAVVAAAWESGFDPYFGWANRALGLLSPHLDRAWLGDSSVAILVVAVVAILHSTGFPMIVVLGALRNIPSDVHDAASLDGVTPWQRVRHISIPLVSGTIMVMLCLQFIWGFLAFDYVFVMTRGGPGTASEVVNTYIFRQAFIQQQFGYAAAAATMVSALIGPLIFLYTRIQRFQANSRAR